MKLLLTFLLVISTQFGQGFLDLIRLQAEVDQQENLTRIAVYYDIDEGWHIYGFDTLKNGPIPTSIVLSSGTPLTLVEKAISKPHFDEGFEMNVEWYGKTGRFVYETTQAIESTDEILFTYQICTERFCHPSKTKRIPLIDASTPIVINEALAYVPERVKPKPDPVSFTAMQDESFLAFIWFAIGFGFLSLITPCVFPMVPITVSFFTKNGEETRSKAIRLGLVYGIGIVTIFTLLGFTITLLFGATGVQNIAANPWLNLLIGLLFIVFALNLFGLFEIQLPTSFVNRVNKLGMKPGYAGVLLAGVAFALVTFTCTAPFVGTLLSQAAQGDQLYPFFGMLFYSAAFASPFVLLAIFPQLIAQMPRSGGWLHATKIVMAFFEIAAAFKFFSQSDLVWDLEILTRPLMIAIWFVLFLISGLYLLGVFRLSEEDRVEKIGVVRLFTALIFIVFSVYLVSGLTGRPLQTDLDAYLPPTEYGQLVSNVEAGVKSTPHLSWIENYQDGLNEAKATNTYIFLDFTGKTCTNCRWMEKRMFVLPEVQSRFNEMTRIRLWTDFGDQKEFNQELQLSLFNSVALPYYAILDADGNVIRAFSGMTRNKDEFLDFLNLND